MRQRLLALPAVNAPAVADRIESLTIAARQRGTGLELLTLAVLAELEHAGIRALPLKGSTLGRALYGDPAMRSSSESTSSSRKETSRTRLMSYAEWDGLRKDDTSDTGWLPDLHERLVHPKPAPRVEVHWRVHYYESRFAAEVLARGATSGRRAAPHAAGR